MNYTCCFWANFALWLSAAETFLHKMFTKIRCAWVFYSSKMWVFTKVVRKRCTTTGYWPKNSHGTGSGNQLNGRLAAKMTVSGTSSGTTDFDTERRRRRVLTADATDPECLDAWMPDIPTSCRSWSFELNKQRRASRQSTTLKAQGNREPGPAREPKRAISLAGLTVGCIAVIFGFTHSGKHFAKKNYHKTSNLKRNQMLKLWIYFNLVIYNKNLKILNLIWNLIFNLRFKICYIDLNKVNKEI